MRSLEVKNSTLFWHSFLHKSSKSAVSQHTADNSRPYHIIHAKIVVRFSMCKTIASRLIRIFRNCCTLIIQKLCTESRSENLKEYFNIWKLHTDPARNYAPIKTYHNSDICAISAFTYIWNMYYIPYPRTCKMPCITLLLVFCIVVWVRLYWAEKHCWNVNWQEPQ